MTVNEHVNIDSTADTKGEEVYLIPPKEVCVVPLSYVHCSTVLARVSEVIS